MERYAEAIAKYETLSGASARSGDWLRAHVGIANCFSRTGQREAAMTALRAAKAQLDRMPEDAIEQMRIGMPPVRWQEWLDWFKRL